MTRWRIPRSLRQRVVAEYRNRCAYCHTLTAITGARLVIDHIIPEAAGGQTAWENRNYPAPPAILSLRGAYCATKQSPLPRGGLLRHTNRASQ